MAYSASLTSPRRTGSGAGLAATAGALAAFAANSLLCREALRSSAIDPVSFTTARLASGAVAISLLVRLRSEPAREERSSPLGALALFAYALCFSLAYVHVPAGTGALLLFGAVQLTMILTGVAAGERPRSREWTGLGIAAAGLAVLLGPTATAPPLGAAALMVTAGTAWGVYSLLGRGSRDPLGETARRFTGALPLAAMASAVSASAASLSARGLLLALVSGALASGAGYAVWYRALRDLTATRAALVQLAVPALAAAGGALLLGEPVTASLLVAGILTLGGIALARSSPSQH